MIENAELPDAPFFFEKRSPAWRNVTMRDVHCIRERKVRIMGLTGKEVEEMHRKYILQSWSKAGSPAVPVERAEGIFFYDYDGNKYADMSSLLVCSNLGHQNRETGGDLLQRSAEPADLSILRIRTCIRTDIQGGRMMRRVPLFF